MAGPYVDHACTNEYAVTLSTPVTSARGLLGVAAADVLVASLERRVLPALTRLPGAVALTNADGRVIAANDPELLPGLRLILDNGEPPRARRDSPLGAWRVVELAR